MRGLTFNIQHSKFKIQHNNIRISQADNAVKFNFWKNIYDSIPPPLSNTISEKPDPFSVTTSFHGNFPQN